MTKPTIDRFEGQYRWLSNFSTMGGAKPTAEHQFQAHKATCVEDAIYVMAAKDPAQAKRRGRSIKCREEWDALKIDVMYEVLVLKFSDATLRQKLLDTGEAELIEGNDWGDKYWGKVNGNGKNYLGQLLMLIRTEILYSHP